MKCSEGNIDEVVSVAKKASEKEYFHRPQVLLGAHMRTRGGKKHARENSLNTDLTSDDKQHRLQQLHLSQ